MKLARAAVEIFFASDQPTTCPYCGARTEWMPLRDDAENSAQDLHCCLNPACQAIFIVEAQEEASA